MEAALLSKILGAVGKQTARFEVDGTSATIVYSTGHFNFAVQNADEYPQVEENIEAVDSFTMQADELAKAVAMCRVFAGNDELRPITTSVCMDMSGEHLVSKHAGIVLGKNKWIDCNFTNGGQNGLAIHYSQFI